MTPRARKPTRKGGVPVVKTSLFLPEDLWRAAKHKALDEGRDLRDLIVEGLTLVLKRRAKKEK